MINFDNYSFKMLPHRCVAILKASQKEVSSDWLGDRNHFAERFRFERRVIGQPREWTAREPANVHQAVHGIQLREKAKRPWGNLSHFDGNRRNQRALK
jgi:hypothetical protein